MRFELFVALRYLFSRRGGQKLISITSIISVAGVALGVGALIVVMGVMNGFTVDLRDKIIGVTSHAIIFDSSALKGKASPELLSAIRSVPGVTGATPFLYAELMISTATGAKGIALRGIDPATAPGVLGALSKITLGSVEELANPEGLPGIIVGKDLAKRLQLSVGSRVNVLAPSGQQSAAGFNPRIKAFRVVGIFAIELYEYDSSVAFVSLDSARGLLGMEPDTITGIEIAVNDVYKAEAITDAIIERLGPQYYAQTWMTMNANLFAALKLEKVAMAIILTLVVLVGSFSIITALVMLVMEKTRDIAVLMSMGATSRAIRRIFMLQGVIIGVMGTGIGYGLGLGVSWLLSRYRFIQLPKGVYSLDYIPVLLHGQDLVATGVCAMLLCFLATLYPSHQAASVEPVAALRSE